MRMKIYGMALLMTFLVGLVDVALAGGGSKNNSNRQTDADIEEYFTFLTDAQVEECAANPEKLVTIAQNRAPNVRADAVARVLDKIVELEGIDSPKIGVVLSSLSVNFATVGRMMEDSPNKNQILLKIQETVGNSAANDYAATSGATFPDAPPVGTGGQGGGSNQNTPPPPTQNTPAPVDEQTTTPPPQPPVGQGYAGQQLQ